MRSVFQHKGSLLLPLIVVCFLLGFALSSSSVAGEVSVAGFATFAFGKTFDSDEGPIGRINADGDFRDFSKLGIRLDSDVGEGLSFTAQMLVNGREDYAPTFNWIYAQYIVNDEWSFVFGRTLTPVFWYSDLIDVSYTYQWLTPPLEVYDSDQIPFASFDGPKVIWNKVLGNWNSELILYAGKADEKFSVLGVDDRLVLENMLGFSWSVANDWLAIRSFYVRASTSIDATTNSTVADLLTGSGAVMGGSDPTIGSFNNYSIANVEYFISSISGTPVNLQNDFLFEEDDSQFYGLGFKVEINNWYLISEYTRIEVDTSIIAPILISAYASLGYRVSPIVTTAITIGADDENANKDIWQQFDPFIGPAGLIGGALDAVLVPYQAGIEEVTKTIQEFKAVNRKLSVRWDFHTQAAFKVELIHRRAKQFAADSRSVLGYLIGIDMVF